MLMHGANNMEPHHKVVVPLAHRITLATATRYLVQHLGCDSWYVAAHREHQYVLHLTSGETKRFAVLIQCTEPVDKAIYRESYVSQVGVLPLGNERELPADKVQEIMDLARGEEFADRG